MVDTKLQITTVDSYQNQPTDDPHLFRVVDREGNWTHYYQDEIKRYLPAVNHIIQLGFPKGIGLINWLKKMDEAQAEKILNSASERGAKIHAAIRTLIDGLILTMKSAFPDDDGNPSVLTYDEWDCVISWTEWAKVFKPRVLQHESAVWSPTYFYAGTKDFSGTIELPEGVKLYIDDKLTTIKKTKRISVLLDWKSGGTYDDHKLQVAAYAGCLKVKPTGEFYTGIVRVGTKHQNGGFEMRLWSRERTKYHFKRFLEAINQYKFVTGDKVWEPNIVKIPLSLEIKVPQIQPRQKAKSNATASGKSLPNKQGQTRKPAQN